ncbi:metal-dependent amidase/aminoacylase/carboxypeptidase family protein [Clavibacter michiganensis]|uniref:hypothetical protein n=1 Tax=Clavibacter michiganensis TaxID=28447 RepID=UPI001D7A99A0|nr:hypothetical protein [Clavibacter michiganensis]MBP2458386.1 metal-dependent amidase/aminoacylase/carboxypeptidase family protein [Clavibacter michiganensis]MDQ0410957.1 metal-dependent amidase/aminoacylase/carboxypeptidase family protein [Clavibacter michiganensis]
MIPDTAELLLSMRSFDDDVRDHALTAIRRIASGESLTAGAPQEADVDVYESFPAVVNDPASAMRTVAAFRARFGAGSVIAPGAVTGSEDIGLLAAAAGAPCCFWLLGGGDPALFEAASSAEEITRIVARQPSNHSSAYAPVVQPTLDVGVAALVAAARCWLATT